MHANFKNESCLVVSFSGMDGAGKSTQIDALCSRMRDAGLRVRLITFWDDVAKFTGVRETTGHKLFKGDKGVGTPEAPINRRDKNVRSGFMTCVRLGLYFVDAISLREKVRQASQSDTDFLVCDRYIYDELANLELRNPAARAYIRFIMKLVPKPHLSYFLDADPVQARARKPEYPLDFLYTSRASYLALSELLGGITVIPPMPISDVSRRILEPVLQLLSRQGIPVEQAEDLAH